MTHEAYTQLLEHEGKGGDLVEWASRMALMMDYEKEHGITPNAMERMRQRIIADRKRREKEYCEKLLRMRPLPTWDEDFSDE